MHAKESCSGLELDGRMIRVDFSLTKKAHEPTPGRYYGKKSYPNFRNYNNYGAPPYPPRYGGRNYNNYGRPPPYQHDMYNGYEMNYHERRYDRSRHERQYRRSYSHSQSHSKYSRSQSRSRSRY